MKCKPLLLAWLALLLASPAQAGRGPQAIRQSVRALGMGDAFLAVSNDESALFYNPAGLNRVETGQFEILGLQLGYNDATEFAANNSDKIADNLDQFVGNQVYLDLGLSYFSYTTTNFSYQLFDSAFFDVKIYNPVIPYFGVTAFTQRGQAIGFSFGIEGDGALGIGFKKITRTGANFGVHVSDLFSEEGIGTLDDYVEEASAQAFDLGWMQPLGELPLLGELQGALVWRNIGGLEFGEGGSIEESLDFGFAGTQQFQESHVTLAFDALNLRRAKPETMQNNFHYGLEWGLWPQANGRDAFALRAGVKGVYPTWGLTLNPKYLPLTLEYAVWSEEVGRYSGAYADRRKAIRFSINF